MQSGAIGNAFAGEHNKSIATPQKHYRIKGTKNELALLDSLVQEF